MAELHGLVLAGGEGSRLAGGGVPKPLVRVAGRPQLVHLIETLAGLGCPSVTCLVRDDFGAAVADVERRRWAVPVGFHACHTPSSLHTLAEGFARLPAGAAFVTMVDTVMRPQDWRDLYAAARASLDAGSDAVLAVTPFVDDEAALYVSTDAGGRVRRLSAAPLEPVSVTGGAYAFAAGVRPLATEAVADGVARMRNFLARLVDRGHVVTAVSVPRIIDLDRPSDLEAANAWLAGKGEDRSVRGGT